MKVRIAKGESDAKALDERTRNADRPPANAIETGECDARGRHGNIVAQHTLTDNETAGFALERFDRDVEAIVQSCSILKIHLRTMHGERDAVFALELCQREAQRIEPFGARAFHETQIVRVIDDACGIGVFVIDANEEGEAAQRFRDRRRGPEPPPA